MSSKTFTNERWALVLVPPPPSTASSSCSLTCTYTCSKLRCARPHTLACAWLARPWGQQAPHFCSKKRPAAAASLLPICLGGSQSRDAGWVRVYAQSAAQPSARAYLKRRGACWGAGRACDARGAAKTRQRPQGASATSHPQGMRRCIGCGVPGYWLWSCQELHSQ
jgi:hypothetical protein